MSSEILVAILSLVGTALGTFGGINLMKYRLSQLENKVDKHNHLIERQYNIEKITAVLSEDLKVANHRIEDLEGALKNEKH
jgi:hypothetical protein